MQSLKNRPGLDVSIRSQGLLKIDPGALDPGALDLMVFREMPFTFFTLGIFLVFVPYYVPLTYGPTSAQTALRTSDDLAGYPLAIVNAVSLLGRTVPYILSSMVTPSASVLLSLISTLTVKNHRLVLGDI